MIFALWFRLRIRAIGMVEGGGGGGVKGRMKRGRFLHNNNNSFPLSCAH